MASWKLLEDMMLELRKNGVEIPPKVLGDLRAAKSMIKLSCRKDSHGETIAKAEEYSANVEAYLVNEAQKTLGPERVDTWLKSLEEANLQICEEPQKPAFVTGVPRDQKWVRIEPIAELSKEQIVQFAEENKLHVKPEDDGRLVVFGDAEALRTFVKAMTAQASKQPLT
jgi:hypothetical protein